MKTTRQLPYMYWSEKYFKQYTSALFLLFLGQRKGSFMLCLYRTKKFLNLCRWSPTLPISCCVRLDERLMWFGNLDAKTANCYAVLTFPCVL